MAKNFDPSKIQVLRSLGILEQTDTSRVEAQVQTYDGGEPGVFISWRWKRKVEEDSNENWKYSKGFFVSFPIFNLLKKRLDETSL